MPGISSMLPKGGEAIWGNLTWAPDDLPGQADTFGSTLKFSPKNGTVATPNMTVTDSLRYLLNNSNDWYKNQITGNYSHGVAHTRQEIEVCGLVHRKCKTESAFMGSLGKRKKNRKVDKSSGVPFTTGPRPQDILLLW